MKLEVPDFSIWILNKLFSFHWIYTFLDILRSMDLMKSIALCLNENFVTMYYFF